MDIDEIINRYNILDYSHKEDGSYSDLRGFISKTASLLGEFSGDDSGGTRLMAKILFRKFPNNLKGEMILMTGRRMATLSSILQLTSEATKPQLIKGSVSSGSTFDTSRNPLRGLRLAETHHSKSVWTPGRLLNTITDGDPLCYLLQRRENRFS